MGAVSRNEKSWTQATVLHFVMKLIETEQCHKAHTISIGPKLFAYFIFEDFKSTLKTWSHLILDDP